MKSLAMMVSFFTRIPVRVAGDIDEAMYRKGIKFLPLIALIIGVPTGALMLLNGVVGPYVAAFLAVLAYLFLSGALHMDGMADTMDAFGSNRDRDTMLAIMKDSHIGTFGVLAVCVCVVGMTIGLANADMAAAWLFPLAGRAAALLCARIFPCARPGGLGKWFIDGVTWAHAVEMLLVYAAATAAVCYFTDPLTWVSRGLMLLAAGAGAAGLTLFIVWRMARKLGGMTGDVIGFAIESAQLIYLLIVCAAGGLWR